MSERFYTNSPLHPGRVELVGDEAHHLAVVCRLGPGDSVRLFNGDGHEYPARIVQTSRRHAALEVLAREAVARELPITVEIAAPLPRGDRGQFLVEKLTELGVATYVPLLCERSVIHPREGKIDKLQRYVIAASKQCGRNVLMKVASPTAWVSYVEPRGPAEVRILAHPVKATSASPVASALHDSAVHAVRVALGPEGGFSDDEVSAGRAGGWKLIDLGPRILRVETAALFVASILGSGQVREA